MNKSTPEDGNLKIAIELSQKYDFYFLALVFTVLALSVQTAEVINEYYQYFYEIGAWTLFSISGLAGLSRLEWLPNAYIHYSSSEIEKNNLKAVKNGNIMNEKGETWPSESLSKAENNLERQIKKREKEIGRIERSSLIKYRWHKWCFILGIFSLIISRAIFQLIKIGVLK